MTRKHSKRDLLLDFAEKIVLEESASKLTLDHLAARAGVSKGGLLYHFASKEDLLRAIIERLIKRFDNYFESYLQKNCQALVIDAYMATAMNSTAINLFAGVLAVVSYDSVLLDPLRESYKKWDQLLGKALGSEVEAMKIRLIFDGIFFSTLLKLPMPNKKVLNQICRELRESKSD